MSIFNSSRQLDYTRLALGLVLVALSIWAYLPTWGDLLEAWNTQADYSHGYFVIPLSIYMLWARRDLMPQLSSCVAWPGLLLICLSIAIRYIGAHYFLGSVDGWSLVFWTGGVVWLLCGRRVFLWSSPAILFLMFMVPLPFRAEQMLSYPLRRLATKISCGVLQFFGQAGVAEGNTIYLGEHHLEVADACSGLRIFMGVAALAFVYVVLVRRAWWERALLLVSVVPIALAANAARIVVTGFLYQYVSSEAAMSFTHDIAGLAMIPFAALLFAAVLKYERMLIIPVTEVEAAYALRAASR